MDIEIQLANDEEIVRVYTRTAEQGFLFRKLVRSDFARNMNVHSGISLLRLGNKYLTRKQALNWFRTKKLKGLAISKAQILKELGCRFFAKSADDPHVSMRCPPCNLEVEYSKLCKSTDGKACMLDLQMKDSLSKTLSKVFMVDTPIRT